MKLFFDDVNLDGQLQRSVAKVESGAANIGECLYIASLIKPGNRDSWYEQWSVFATSLIDQADKALDAGHRVSARGCYLRAAEYFRQAFFWHRDDLDGRKLQAAYAASVAAFRAALPLFDPPGVVLDGETPGYLAAPAGTGPFPVIVHIGGYDGTAEETFTSASHALARGWMFASFDGPGTGAPLYQRRQHMRPDWENVVPGMIDRVLEDPRVDADRVVLVGRSFGGLLAPRGAAGERRLAAMVVDPGQYDMAQTAGGRLGELGDHLDDPSADEQFQSLLTVPAFQALLAPRMATHGLSSVREYFVDLRRYNCREQAPAITCPSFVTDNETDVVSTGQGQQLFDALTAPKEFRRFRRDEGAEGHCEGMGATVFWTAALDWLDTVLG